MSTRGITPAFAIVQVGNYPPSDTYVNVKMRKAKELGIIAKIYKFSQVQSAKFKVQNDSPKLKMSFLRRQESIRKNPLEIRMNPLRAQREIEKLIEKLNNDFSIHGIIIQRPLPPTIDATHLQSLIDPHKDIDGLSPNSPFMNPLVQAVAHVINYVLSVGDDLRAVPHADRPGGLSLQKQILQLVIVGKGRTAGKPIYEYFSSHPIIPISFHVIPAKAGILLDVKQIDSQTPNPDEILKKADIIISCVGKPNILRRDNIKKGAVLISVGQHLEYQNVNLKMQNDNLKFKINSLIKNFELKIKNLRKRQQKQIWVGDYNEEEIKNLAAAYTPTPRGIGPLNVIFLLKNVVKATK